MSSTFRGRSRFQSPVIFVMWNCGETEPKVGEVPSTAQPSSRFTVRLSQAPGRT